MAQPNKNLHANVLPEWRIPTGLSPDGTVDGSACFSFPNIPGSAYMGSAPFLEPGRGGASRHAPACAAVVLAVGITYRWVISEGLGLLKP
jgi:hypothetical protein